MFTRNFMSSFRIRKYGNPTAAGGNINTDLFLLGQRDYVPMRAGIYLLTTCLVLMASQSFEIFYEVIKHPSPPYHHDKIQSNVPVSVSLPNEDILTKMKTLHEMKTFMKSFQ